MRRVGPRFDLSRFTGVPLVVLVMVILVAFPGLGASDLRVRQILLVATLTLVVSGFNLAYGYAGELAVGQIAMYAAGAYVSGILLVHGNDMALAFVVAACVAAALGFLTGVPGLRLGGWGLAMASFFLVVLLPDVVQIFEEQTGGLVGLSGIPKPELLGVELDQTGMYRVGVVVTGCWLLVMRNLVVSRHGVAFRVLRRSPILAQSLGMSVFKTKLVAYALGAVPAGLAGTLLVSTDRFIAPEYFELSAAISIIAASILGGSQSVYGPLFGAAILVIGPAESGVFRDYTFIAYGVLLLVGGALFSGGLAGFARWFVRGRHEDNTDQVVGHRRTTVDAVTTDAARAARFVGTGVRLSLDGVTKSFGGVAAVRDLSIVAEPATITGLIGANGSGKTTTINLITGFYRPDRGEVRRGNTPITNMPPHLVARGGVARTFQTPIIPDDLSTLDVVASARYVRQYVGLVPAILRLPRFRAVSAADRREAMQILQWLGIDDLAERSAAALPLGSRRLVEVARALATEPSVLLLDEPAAGLDAEDVARLETVMRDVRDAGVTVVLIEHNFDLVCNVSDNIYALDFGQVIAVGSPNEIRVDPAVSRSYLGIEVNAMADPVHDDPALTGG